MPAIIIDGKKYMKNPKSGCLVPIYKREKFEKRNSNRIKVANMINMLWANGSLSRVERLHLSMIKDGRFADLLKDHLMQDVMFVQKLEENGSKEKAFKYRQKVDEKILKIADLMVQVTNNKNKESKVKELFDEIEKIKQDQIGIIDV